MNIVFCADRGVVPGLHVALYSVLDRYKGTSPPDFTIFSDDLNEADRLLLQETLNPLEKPYSLQIRRVDPDQFKGFAQLNGSWATYYRLLITSLLDVERFLYLDADILCDLDVSPLLNLEMGGSPAGLVPEAPLSGAADRYVAEQLGNSSDEPYFNAGIILINRREWNRQRISEQAMEYLLKNPAHFWDQSALNVVLFGKAFILDEQYNTITNMRKNWPEMRSDYGGINRLIHFVDYPKPWDLMGEFVHPHHSLWHSVLEKTVLVSFQSWHDTPARRFPVTVKSWDGYKRTLKDRLLFTGYKNKWLKSIKGVSR